MALGVIFDMDGVLVDSGAAHRESWRALARRHGLEISDQTFADTFGMQNRDIIRDLWGDQFRAEDVPAIDAEKEIIYRELVSGAVPVSPGAIQMLENLHQAGFVMAVGTSGPPENLELVLRETGMGRFFAATVHGHEIEHGKPAPDVFLRAAQRAGLRAGECVVVEDAPVGIQAARAAAMRAIGYVGTHPAARLIQAGAETTVQRLTEITPDLVRQLLGG